MMKGIATMLVQIIGGLLFIALSIFLYVLFVSNFFEIQLSVTNNEVQRHAMLMANALMSSPQLVYVDDYQLHRGVFDRDKLDNLGGIASEISYPNSTALIRIYDLDENDPNKREYKTLVRGIYNDQFLAIPELNNLLTCFSRTTDQFSSNLLNLNIFHLFDVFNQEAFNSCIDTEASKRGFHQGIDFPVAIRIVDDVTKEENYHHAILSVSLYEV